MNIILQPPVTPDRALLGGKAAALAHLDEAGLSVPPWFVVSPAAFQASVGAEGMGRLRASGSPDKVAAILAPLSPARVVREELDAALEKLCPGGERVAVRSSAVDEDGSAHSFAGQLESYLGVPLSNVAERVADVWRSGFTPRVWAYRREHGLKSAPSAPAVLVQRMVNAETAGVAFSADPVTGRRGVAIVSAMRGLGDALVSGAADADTFAVGRDGEILSRSFADGSTPVLNEEQIRAVAALARQAERQFGCPQDIEWAIEAGKLWLLQSRPVTTLGAMPDPDGELRIWDNSNIAESYGGITTPLTYSFARRAYEEVYRQFCWLMRVPPATIDAHADTFRCMIGLVRGRVFYNLVSWYRVLAMLPGYTVNRRFMEQMMGVKEGVPEEALPRIQSPDLAAQIRDALNLAHTLVGLVWNHLTLSRQIAGFYDRLNCALVEPRPPLEQMRPDELAAHYRDLERQLLTRWDAPLVNDFFAMIFHGLLRRLCEKWCSSPEGALANDLIREQGGIISAEPARRLKDLAALAVTDPRLLKALKEGTPADVRRAAESSPEFKQKLDEYLAKFGDRCLDELKLESATLHDDALPLFRAIGALGSARASRAVSGASPETPSTAGVDRGGSGGPPDPARESRALPSRSVGEEKVHRALGGRRVRLLLFNWVLRHARDRVRDRENLRFERTRLFGRVRRIFVELGKRLCAVGCLTDSRDVFYLEVNEALGFLDGTTTTTDLKSLVVLRHAEFDRFRQMPAPADRFETRGVVNHAHAYQPRELKAQPFAGGEARQGLGCCPGVVRGPVRVITDPRAALIQSGEILVAERTDPGWVMLFPAAAGLLVERGSLLSHSAIVSRELGLPGIVSITGLTAWLKTGDVVEMDGSTGLVRRLS